MSESLKTLGIAVAFLVCAVIWYLWVYYFLKKWSTNQVHPLNEQQPQNGGGDQQLGPLNHGDGDGEAQPGNHPHQQEAHLGGNGQGEGQEDPPHHHGDHHQQHLPLLLDGNDGNHRAPRTAKVQHIQDQTLSVNELKETTVNSGENALVTFGYDAPEYAMSGKLNAESVLPSLGVVLLKLLARKKAFDRTLESGQQRLVSWAIPKDRYCVDEKLGGGRIGGRDCPTKAVAMYVRYEEAVFRPNMNIHKLCNFF